ncbi:MAG: aminotransferase class V-fold PLP-dependent enzyme, partial [Chloroflexota bacterium]
MAVKKTTAPASKKGPSKTSIKRPPLDVKKIRDQVPAVKTTAYLNAGTNGPIPLVAQKALADQMEKELEIGRIVPGVYEGNFKRNRANAAIAADLFGCHPDELALSHSTGEGMNTILNGILWQPGDEVLTTNLEHPCLINPLNLLSHRQGIVTRYADIGNGGGNILAALEPMVTSRTRVIAISHVQWSTGAVMPLKEIAAYCRKLGIILLVDGAQSAGQIAINLHDLGVDAYAMPGQKWLCGPESTGFLYVRKDRFPDMQPTFIRYAQFDTTGYLVPNATAARFELGEFFAPAIEAQMATLTWLRDEVGMDRAYARIAELGQRAHAGLSKIKDVTVLTPKNKMAG